MMEGERTKKICIRRELNPGLPRGRRKSCHWTTDALAAAGECAGPRGCQGKRREGAWWTTSTNDPRSCGATGRGGFLEVTLEPRELVPKLRCVGAAIDAREESRLETTIRHDTHTHETRHTRHTSSHMMVEGVCVRVGIIGLRAQGDEVGQRVVEAVEHRRVRSTFGSGHPDTITTDYSWAVCRVCRVCRVPRVVWVSGT